VSVPGVFSGVGRQTEADIRKCRDKAGVEEVYQHQPQHAGDAAPSPSKRKPYEGAAPRVRAKPASGASVAPQAAAPDGERKCGELERAIQERIRLKLKLQKEEPAPDRTQAERTVKFVQESHQFKAQGFDDGPWSSKFTASKSPGALNRKNEQRVDPGWYRPQHGAVLDSSPTWTIGRTPHKARRRPGDEEDEPRPATPQMGAMQGWSLTTLDDLEETLRERTDADKPKTQLALAPPRPALNKSGRVQHQGLETSCVPTRFLNQDITGHSKQRPPEWDFEKVLNRPPLTSNDSMSAPGKYDIPWGNGVVSAPVKTGVPFDRGLSRDEAYAGQLGHGAHIASVMPENVRNPGRVCVPDRSKAKDSVRTRHMKVNNFGKDLGRYEAGMQAPPQEELSEEAARRIMTYDPILAESPVKARRDVVRPFAGMSERGQNAVQGVRFLQGDLGVRGAVGLGFRETSVQRSGVSVEDIESRAVDGAREKPDRGPVFDHYSARCGPTHAHSSPQRGSLRRPLPTGAAFTRHVSAPGFTKRAAFGGRAAPGSRSCGLLDAIPNWEQEVHVAASAK